MNGLLGTLALVAPLAILVLGYAALRAWGAHVRSRPIGKPDA